MAEDGLAVIEKAQARWAKDRRLPSLRPGYVPAVEDNLFLGGLNPPTEDEFRAGDGAELTPSGSWPPKMWALASSSALAANIFDYWRTRDTGPLQTALQLIFPINDLVFEHKCKGYPVPPRSPNIDVMLRLGGGSRLAIEAKFSEPFSHK